MQIETLLTNRLILRKLTPEVFTYIYETYSNEQLILFLGLSSEKELELEKEKYQKGLVTFNKSFLYFQLLDRDSEKIIGWCGYHTWYLDHDRAEIGYGLFKDIYKNKGIMSEAMESILKYGFNHINLNRVEAFIGTNNVPSLKLVEKFGFAQEGHLRSHYCKNNVIEDSLVFSLLQEEYCKQ